MFLQENPAMKRCTFGMELCGVSPNQKNSNGLVTYESACYLATLQGSWATVSWGAIPWGATASVAAVWAATIWEATIWKATPWGSTIWEACGHSPVGAYYLGSYSLGGVLSGGPRSLRPIWESHNHLPLGEIQPWGLQPGGYNLNG